MEFTVKAGPEVQAYLGRIADSMVSLLSVPRDEAVGRINRHFAGVKFGKRDMLFHDSPDAWAKTIYYGKDSAWWRGEEGLEPLPYP